MQISPWAQLLSSAQWSGLLRSQALRGSTAITSAKRANARIPATLTLDECPHYTPPQGELLQSGWHLRQRAYARAAGVVDCAHEQERGIQMITPPRVRRALIPAA